MIRSPSVPRPGPLMGFALFQLVCGCGAAALVLVVAAAMLRLAIVLTNRSLGAKPVAQPRSGGIAEWDWDDWDDEQPLEPVRPWRAGKAVPEAGTIKCMVVMFLTALVYGFGFVVMGFAAQDFGFRMQREETRLAVLVLELPVAWVVLTVLLGLFLPTNLWRAGMAAFIYGLLVLAFFMVVGVVVFVLAVVAR